MKRVYCLMMTVGIILSYSFAENSVVTDSTGNEARSDSSAVADSVVMKDTGNVALPLCTLAVTTDQPEVTVKLDGTTIGVSPLNIVNVDTGKHVLVLEKSGFYQKKVVITLNERKSTPLHFSLTAPGMLSVVSEPSGAVLTINGGSAGETPLTDSLMKPGTYQITLSKEHFTSITDSVTIKSGQKTVITDTLIFTTAYRDSVAQAGKTAGKKSKKVHTAIVAGIFGLFLLVLAIIEVQE